MYEYFYLLNSNSKSQFIDTLHGLPVFTDVKFSFMYV